MRGSGPRMTSRSRGAQAARRRVRRKLEVRRAVAHALDVHLAGRVSHDFVASVERNAIARVGQDLDDGALLDAVLLGDFFYPFGLPTSPRREPWPDRSSRCRNAARAVPVAAFRGGPCRACLTGA